LNVEELIKDKKYLIFYRKTALIKNILIVKIGRVSGWNTLAV